ncbi:hypothetical protein MP228_006222 [Amoeboaphelidium protococcarum]|nr:hypothetical protein MP228_006222 [Amoeboaphelidium protococcarum]
MIYSRLNFSSVKMFSSVSRLIWLNNAAAVKQSRASSLAWLNNTGRTLQNIVAPLVSSQALLFSQLAKKPSVVKEHDPNDDNNSNNQRKLKKPSFTPDRHYQATKHPIVLCHGLFGYDRIGPINYWTGISDVLESQGAKVYVARVSAVGGIEQRAIELERFLEQNLAGQDVNLVCHSMGGLDARHLIAHLKKHTFKVRSLVTLSTPHRGSPFMDWIRDHVGVGLAEDARKQDVMAKVMAILDAPAYYNLTTEFLTQKFNPSTPDNPYVKYYSYGATIDNASYLSPLRIPWDIVKAKEGENDGVVSVYSARWGQYVQTLKADHFDLNRTKKFYESWSLPSFDNHVLGPLVSLASYLDPIVKAIPTPSLSVPSPILNLSQKIIPSSSSSSGNSNSIQQAQSQQLSQQQDQHPYLKRVHGLLNQIHGPSSWTEYVYGYENESANAKAVNNQANNDNGEKVHDHNVDLQGEKLAAQPSFDARVFYLEVMELLAKDGF